MIRNCNKVMTAVMLKGRDMRFEAEDDEECNLTVISDTDGTSISMNHTEIPPVENVKNNSCQHVGIDLKFASVVTLYDAEDTEDAEVQDKCAPPRPEVPEDFVPRCGR